MNAELLSIGTELLVGQIVNTNAAFLARELAGLGIDLYRGVTVGDNLPRLVDAMRQAASRADLVLCTGGLGPTPDDLTIAAIAELVGQDLELRPEALAKIEATFAQRNRTMTDMDRKQAMFPASGELIPNPAGTAPGLSIQHGKTTFMAFPGVPHELEAMWRTWAVSHLPRSGTLRSRLLKFAGASEAQIADQVSDLLEGTNPTVAPYTGQYEIHLRLSAKADSPQEADRMLDPLEREIMARIGAYYFGRDEQSLVQVVGDRLRQSRATIATAESVTGGLLASRLTDVPGASEYFAGGMVVYSVEQKIHQLGADPDLFRRHGAVSAEASAELAFRVRERMQTDWGIGVTGYASEAQGVAPDDVGRVFLALCSSGGHLVQHECRFGRHPRMQIKTFATQVALAMLLRQLERASQVQHA